MRMLSLFYLRTTIYFTLTLLGTYSLLAQNPEIDNLETKALNYFNSGNYSEAKIIYEGIQRRYPQDLSSSYYLGRCYLNLNIQLKEAIEHLKRSATGNFNTDVHFYLFKAYYQNYSLPEAKVTLQNFENLAKRKQEKYFQLEFWKKAVENLVNETKEIYVYSAQNYQSFIEGKYANHYSKNVKEQLFTIANYAAENVGASVCKGSLFEPSKLISGDYLFMSKAGKKRNGTDLFMIMTKEDSNTEDYRPIEKINSVYDERCPYYDAKTQTLYFSSNRLGSLGGLDIYKSEYNTEDNVFSEPQRLDFPINSPFNDYLFVPDSLGKTAVFFSDRIRDRKEGNTYGILLSELAKVMSPETSEAIKKISLLRIENSKDENVVDTEKKFPVFLKPKLTGYDSLLNQALAQQLVCDSLHSEIISYKAKLREESLPNKRNLLFRKIKTDERILAEAQFKATKLFKMAQALRLNEPELQITSNSKTQNSSIVLSKMVRDIKVFSYNSNQKELKKEAPKKADENNFEISTHSPYSAGTPIPKDITLPGGLIYRIQLGVFSLDIAPDEFGGLQPLSIERITGKDLTRYYVGLFKTAKEGRTALQKVKNYGYSDAFLVPYFNNDKITIHEAREIEFGEKK